MKAVYRASLLLIAFVFLFPLSARSEIKELSIEAGPFGGYNFFQNSQNIKDHYVYGGRLGYNFTKKFGVEGTAEFIKTHVKDTTLTGGMEGRYRSPADTVKLEFYHLDAIYHFTPDSNTNPFVVAGFGTIHYSPMISIDNKSMGAFNVGVGVKYWVADNTALRFDLSDNMVTEFLQETYHNFGATVELVFAFGGKAKPAPARPEKTEAEPAPAPVTETKPAPEPEPITLAKPAPVKAAKPEPEPKPVTAPEPVIIERAAAVEKPVIIRVAEPDVEEQIYAIAAQPELEEQVIILALEDVHFDFDSSTLTMETQIILKRNLLILNKNPKTKVRIAGYTSASGSNEYNQKLSERRANAVKNYLVKENVIKPDRLSVIGYGEAKPEMYEESPKDLGSEAAMANMRVLFEIIVK